MRRVVVVAALAALVLCAFGCASDECEGAPLCGPVVAPLEGSMPTNLSEMRILGWDPVEGFRYNDRVVPYELNTPLFTDYSRKARAIYVPPGAEAQFEPSAVLSLPVGSIIVKTFYYPADMRRPDEDITLIETRVLVHRPEGWEAHPYVWNEAQTDAVLTPAAPTRTVDFIDDQGNARTSNYLIPSRNQCIACHVLNAEAGDDITPIGPAARNLHRDHDFGGDVGVRNQLVHLEEQGMLAGLPPLETLEPAYDFANVVMGEIPTEELEHAARSYLDVNCAHCHSPTHNNGITSQLFLTYDSEDRFRLGVCKRPGSAGAGTFELDYDIVPGDRTSSILYRRIETTTVGAMMPLLGRSLSHDRGDELIGRWIDAMDPVECGSE